MQTHKLHGITMPLLTKKMLAQRYAVTVGCIDKWMKENKIPYYKLSRRCVRFDAAECDAAINKFKVRNAKWMN